VKPIPGIGVMVKKREERKINKYQKACEAIRQEILLAAFVSQTCTEGKFLHLFDRLIMKERIK